MVEKVIELKNHNKFRGIELPSSIENDTINTSRQEIAATSIHNEGGSSMNETLFDEVKKDLREREERTRQEISEREQRFETMIERYIQESKEREVRYHDESKEREERITQIAQNIEKRTDESIRHMENMKTQNFWGNIALFVGMLAIVITLIVVINQ